jgi:squalene-hopene/tetraprenyl-beta-curcumene cyclase
MAGGDFRSECLANGIKFLLDGQQKDGGWFEVPYTGTGFPKVFYLKYTLYYQYFPLMALTKYLKHAVTE